MNHHYNLIYKYMYNIYRFPIYVIVRTNVLQLRDGHFLIPIIDGGAC